MFFKKCSRLRARIAPINIHPLPWNMDRYITLGSRFFISRTYGVPSSAVFGISIVYLERCCICEHKQFGGLSRTVFDWHIYFTQYRCHRQTAALKNIFSQTSRMLKPHYSTFKRIKLGMLEDMEDPKAKLLFRSMFFCFAATCWSAQYVLFSMPKITVGNNTLRSGVSSRLGFLERTIGEGAICACIMQALQTNTSKYQNKERRAGREDRTLNLHTLELAWSLLAHRGGGGGRVRVRVNEVII